MSSFVQLYVQKPLTHGLLWGIFLYPLQIWDFIPHKIQAHTSAALSGPYVLRQIKGQCPVTVTRAQGALARQIQSGISSLYSPNVHQFASQEYPEPEVTILCAAALKRVFFHEFVQVSLGSPINIQPPQHPLADSCIAREEIDPFIHFKSASW